MAHIDAQIVAAVTQAHGAVIVAIIAGVVAIASAAFSYLGARRAAELTSEVKRLTEDNRLRREFQLDFAAERVAGELMQDPRFKLRSFDVLQSHLGGFEDNELRKVLVRAGRGSFQGTRSASKRVLGSFRTKSRAVGQFSCGFGFE
jgi:hypothetical protein